MLWTSLKKNKYTLSLALIILLFGIKFGRIYFSDNISNLIKDYSYHFNYYRIIIPAICIILSCLMIGPIFGYFSVFLEGMSTSMVYLYYLDVFSFKKFIYYLLFIFITKLIYIILIILLLFFSNNIVKELFKKNKDFRFICLQIKKSIILLIGLTINEVIIFFMGNKLLSLFSFLIK